MFANDSLLQRSLHEAFVQIRSFDREHTRQVKNDIQGSAKSRSHGILEE